MLESVLICDLLCASPLTRRAMSAHGDWQLVPDAASGGYWWNAKTNEVAWTAPQDAAAPDAPEEEPTSPTPAAVPAPAAPASETPAPTSPAPVAPAAAAPAVAPAADAGAWQLIPDAASGRSYWWDAGTRARALALALARTPQP